MTHVERHHFLKILEDIKSCSINTSTSKTGLENKTQEELIETIRQNAAELYRRDIISNSTKLYEHQLPVIKSLEEWMSENSKPIPDAFLFGSLPDIYSTHTDKEKSVFAFRDLFPTLQHDFKNLTNKFHTQFTIEELQKILLKHPNRLDLKMELMRLQRENKTKYIGRPKRKKRK